MPKKHHSAALMSVRFCHITVSWYHQAFVQNFRLFCLLSLNKTSSSQLTALLFHKHQSRMVFPMADSVSISMKAGNLNGMESYQLAWPEEMWGGVTMSWCATVRSLMVSALRTFRLTSFSTTATYYSSTVIHSPVEEPKAL